MINPPTCEVSLLSMDSSLSPRGSTPQSTGPSPSEFKSMSRNRYGWVLLIMLTLVSLFSSLLCIEVGIRIFERFGRGKEQKLISERPARYYVDSESVSLRSNGDVGNFDAAPVRIAVVGDSFTFAPKMQADDAFPARLGRLLNLNAHAPRAAVLNFGTPGFSTFEEERLVRDILARHKPTLVLLEITLNDGQLRRLQEEPPEVRGEFGPYQPQGFERALTSYWHTGRLVLSRLHNQRSREAYVRYHVNLFSRPESRDVFTRSLQKIAKMCRDKEAKLAAIVFPLFDFPIDDEYPFAPVHHVITQLTAATNIPTLDLRRAFKGLELQRLQLIPGVDSHPNEIAHRIAAEHVLMFLFKNHLVPKELNPKKSFHSRENMRFPEAIKVSSGDS